MEEMSMLTTFPTMKRDVLVVQCLQLFVVLEGDCNGFQEGF
jgi:hypothetical protein